MSFSHAQLIYKAAIAAVSPPLLVARAVNFIPQSSTLRIGEHSYKLNRYAAPDFVNLKQLQKRSDMLFIYI